MKLVRLTLFLLLTYTVLGLAQAPKDPPKPAPAATTKAEPKLPPISDKDKLGIRDLQFQITQASIQQRDLAKQYQDLEVQIQSLQSKLNTKVDEVFKAAKLDQKDYQIDSQKLEFTKRPAPNPKK